MLEIGQYIFICALYESAAACKSVALYAIEHRQIIAAAFSTYDYVKFGFYVSDKIGIVDIISQKIKYRPARAKTVLLEIIGIEKSNLGDFQIINFD